MNYKEVIFLSMIFVVSPMWIGYIWTRMLRLEGKVEQILHAWVLGFVTMLAVGQIVLLPLVAFAQTLTTAVWVWKLILQILGVISFFLFLRDIAEKKESCETECRQTPTREMGSTWSVVFGVLALTLILIQAYIPARYEHSDDDDSRFIAEEVSAVVHDTMYQESPISADYMYWNIGEVRKDLTSPWAMFVAMNSKMSGIAPAVLSHMYLPFFLILLCYAVYLLLGRYLFHADWEKTFLFLIFLSVIHMAGYTSTHTLASMLLLRIWQGKAVCASFMLPLLFYLCYQAMHRDYCRNWVALLYVASTAACLLSGIGIVTTPIILFMYGLVDFFYHRRWRKTFAMWMAAVPCAICLGYYLM